MVALVTEKFSKLTLPKGWFYSSKFILMLSKFNHLIDKFRRIVPEVLSVSQSSFGELKEWDIFLASFMIPYHIIKVGVQRIIRKCGLTIKDKMFDSKNFKIGLSNKFITFHDNNR